MNKFKLYFLAICTLLGLFSCGKADDDIVYEQLRYYGPQYAADLALIEQFLQTHYIEEIVNNPGAPNDQDIKISAIPEGDTTKEPIWDSPMLHYKEVYYNLLNYKVYYLSLRDGVGETPTRVDGVLAAYDGAYLSLDGADPISTRFEYIPLPNSFFALPSTIVGWQEIFPLFRNGTVAPGEGSNPALYTDFGAGVMFLPSALAYYNVKQTTSDAAITIPAYSPLMFSFKLYDVRRLDQDGDGILSINEDLDGDGTYTDDDTDGDGTPNYLDTDDDGDGYLTKDECKFVKREGDSPTGTILYTTYYPFNGAVTDDPATEYFDERWGVPNCAGDTQTPTRLRKYLDNSCH